MFRQDRPNSGTLQVIEDKEVNNETEDENLIMLETSNENILLDTTPQILESENFTQVEEHGHLFEQILETQKDFEDLSRVTFNEDKSSGKPEIEWESIRHKELSSREIEKVRSSIQMITRSANPLGKLLDYFQEDFHTVQKELEYWKDKNSSFCVQIAHEKSVTEQYMQPLKTHLDELQQRINEQWEQISTMKANIIKNDHKINKLLTGIY